MFISGKKILLLLLQNRAKGEFHLVRFSKAACLQRVRRGLRVSPDPSGDLLGSITGLEL